MKRIMRYIVIFLVTMFILFFLLVITSKIPKTALEENYKESTEFFINPKLPYINKEIIAVKTNRKDTYLHIYADAMIMNIMYCIDSDNPVKSVVEAKYYSIFNNKNIDYNFNKMIEKDKTGNVQYIRYWHGSMSILRPLLVLFNIEQIYLLNAIIIAILAIILLIMLIKTRIKELVVAYIIGLIMCTVGIVPFCLEYVWTFMIMFVISIISIILDSKNKNLNTIFLLSGMITCYLDFLSTETITVTVPLLIILVIRYKQKRIVNFKEGLKLIAISLIFWGIGYIGMWISKWIIASIVLKVNAMDYVKEDLLYRMGYRSFSTNVIKENLLALFPLNIVKNKEILWLIPISIFILEISLIQKKEWKKLWFSGLLLILAIIPYIRYEIVTNHSYTHCFFTFRAQMVTIMAIVLSIVYSIDKDVAKQRIELRRKR